MDYKEYAKVFKALGDGTRAEIVDMLKGGCMCACKILEKFSLTQPTLSYHMKFLCGCGLVSCKKEGVWNHYTLNNEAMKSAAEFLMAEGAENNNRACGKGK